MRYADEERADFNLVTHVCSAAQMYLYLNADIRKQFDTAGFGTVWEGVRTRVHDILQNIIILTASGEIGYKILAAVEEVMTEKLNLSNVKMGERNEQGMKIEEQFINGQGELGKLRLEFASYVGHRLGRNWEKARLTVKRLVLAILEVAHRIALQPQEYYGLLEELDNIFRAAYSGNRTELLVSKMKAVLAKF